jgi:DNA repair protein RAD16
MLDIDSFNAAVKMSLQFGFLKLISSTALNLEGPNLENVRRCAAVEGRFARENKNVDVDNYRMEFDSDSSAEAPLSQLKKKGKGYVITYNMGSCHICHRDTSPSPSI